MIIRGVNGDRGRVVNGRKVAKGLRHRRRGLAGPRHRLFTVAATLAPHEPPARITPVHTATAPTTPTPLPDETSGLGSPDSPV